MSIHWRLMFSVTFFCRLGDADKVGVGNFTEVDADTDAVDAVEVPVDPRGCSGL